MEKSCKEVCLVSVREKSVNKNSDIGSLLEVQAGIITLTGSLKLQLAMDNGNKEKGRREVRQVGRSGKLLIGPPLLHLLPAIVICGSSRGVLSYRCVRL
jgi:hypothetical protein